MQIVNIFPKLCKLLPGVTDTIMHFGLSLVCVYHLFTTSTVMNTAFDDAKGIEKVANDLLAPVHYLCGGKRASINEKTGMYELSHRYNYETHKKIYSPAAIAFLPQSLVVGGALKALSLVKPEVKSKHLKLQSQLCDHTTHSHLSDYQSLGIQVNDYREGETFTSQHYERRPGDADLLAVDKRCLKEIVSLLSKEKIPFWMDCGSLLGTYRYGGIIPWDNDLDIAVLESDFDNVFHALQALDPTLYVAQDWSSRVLPKTYIRVYLKENRNFIDIYHMQVDKEKGTLTTILSHKDSDWMADVWKERELSQITPYAYDVIFPLKKAQFDGMEVPVPNDTVTYLHGKYGQDLTPIRIYSAETGGYEQDLSHPYWNRPGTLKLAR